MKTLTLLISLVTVLALSGTAVADPPQHRLYAGVAMDTTVVSKLGYELDLGLGRPRLEVALPAELILPVLGPLGGDGELRAGARLRVHAAERLTIGVTLAPLVRTT